jgi:membrane-associated phospholipid phosphatase
MHQATPAFIAATALLALSIAALWIDLPVARYVHAHPLHGELLHLMELAEVFGWGGSVLLIIATTATLDGRGWPLFALLAVPSIGAGLAADAIKLFVARLRPSAALQLDSAQVTFLGWLPVLNHEALGRPWNRSVQSFPSAHSATAVGLALALTAIYPRGKWWFALFASLAMFQRMQAQAHFCSDVLAGAAVGCMTAAIWKSINRPLDASRHSTDTVL